MQDTHHDMATLLLGGIFGTLTRLFLRPEKAWQRWVGQTFVGVATAVFVGGWMAEWLKVGAYGVGGVAFIVGTSAESFLAFVQKKILGDSSETKESK